MAEQSNSVALAKTSVVDGEYMLEVKDFNAAGGSSIFKVAVPNEVKSEQVSVVLRAAILKKTTWRDKDFATILHAVIYADRMGLDIIAGDVYMAEEGRLSTTADAKIRHAMGTGKIRGYNVEITEGKPIKIPYTLKGKDEQWEGPELTAKVTVRVAGWETPIIYETKLSEWFTGRNPNWRSRPAYMLRKNALSKALAEVAPMGVDADEAPPLDTAVNVGVALSQAKQLVEQTKGE